MRTPRVRKIFVISLLVLITLLGLEMLRSMIDMLLLRPLPTHVHPSKFSVVRGVIHVHSRYSDGSGAVETIVQAAQSCSLDFVILTDHNKIDARRDGYEKFYPDSATAERQAGRTLLLVGEELSTSAGHVLSIGASRTHYTPGITDIPELIEGIRADSGVSIIAHPDHPRLGWKRPSFGGAGGVEIINADREWRNDSPLEVIEAFVGELIGLPGMHYLIDLPAENLQRWDTDPAWAGLTGIGSVDTHARLKLFSLGVVAFPSYERMFGLLNTYLILDEPFSENAYLARRQIVMALAQGRSFFAFHSLGDATGFEFYGENKEDIIVPQDTLWVDKQEQATLNVNVPATKNFVVQLYRNGAATGMSNKPESRFFIEGPGAYRVVVFQERVQWPWFSRRRMPWIFSNPIHVKQREAAH